MTTKEDAEDINELNPSCMCKRISSLVLCGLLASNILVMVACRPQVSSEVVEKVPDIIAITNAFGLQHYVVEFSQHASKPFEPTEPLVPWGRGSIDGSVFSVDHNTKCALWLILSHMGSNYYEDQRLYLYSDKSNYLNEVKAFTGMSVRNAFVLSDEEGGSPFILANIRPTNSVWWIRELWTNNIHLSVASRIAIGGECKVAPNHSKVAFWRTDGKGFHSLHIWDVSTGAIEDVISMWEVDPGSGTSWDWDWSTDSKALSIQGACGGFHHHSGRGRKELNLIYLVTEKLMFQVHKKP